MVCYRVIDKKACLSWRAGALAYMVHSLISYVNTALHSVIDY
jgi:hypothetical protein